MSVVRYATWALIGLGGQQLIRFFVLVILARLLTPAEFGVVAAAQIVLAVSQTFVDFGLGIGLLQSKTVDRLTERSAVTVVLASAAVIAILIGALSPHIAGFLGIPRVRLVLPWIGAVFFMQAGSGPLLQLLFRDSRFREVSLLQLATSGAYAAVSILLAAGGWGVGAIIAGMLVQSFFQFAIAFSIRPVWPTLKPDLGRLRPIVHFGVGLTTAQLLGTVARRGDNWVAGRFLGAAALGFYTRAYSLMDVANQIPGVIMTRVMIPHFARHFHSQETSGIAAEQFYLTHVAAAALTIPATIAAVLLAPDIIAVLLGPRWSPAGPIFRVLGAGMFLRLAYKVSSTVVVAYGRPWRSAQIQAVYALLVVGGSLFGYHFGLQGIAWAVLLALTWQFLAQTDLALKSMAGSWLALGRAMLPVLIAGAVASIPAFTADLELSRNAGTWLRLIVIGGALGFSFLACLWLQRKNREIQFLLQISMGLFPRMRITGENSA